MLTNIKSALVVTTSHASTEILRERQGNMIENQLMGHMLETIGVGKSKWINFGGIQRPTDGELSESIVSSLKDAVLNL